MSLSNRPGSLQDWILLFSCLVAGTFWLVCAGVALWWPQDWPVDVWETIAGLSSSALVALIAGLVTIAISWETTQHFGKQSTRAIAGRFQDSLAGTLGSASEVLSAVRGVLKQAEALDGSLVMLALPLEGLLDADKIGKEVVSLIHRRFEKDLPTVWALDPAAVSHGEIWSGLASIAKDEEFFRERFTCRNSLILSVRQQPDTLVLLLESVQGSGFQVKSSVFAFPAESSSPAGYAGIRSEVDRGFGAMVLKRLCAMIQEPVGVCEKSVLSDSDVLSGRYIGLRTTRSIITSQIIQSAGASHRLEAREEFWVAIMSPTDPDREIQFLYSSNCFCPPLHAGEDHSGSVVAKALAGESISVAGKVVWEVGCGPGYVTLQLAEKVGAEGKVLATDVDPDSSRIAGKNIQAANLDSRVTWLSGDCLEFSIRRSLGGSVVIAAPNGDEYEIDMVFVELPLLSFRGNRELTQIESGYFETSSISNQYHLPPAIHGLLTKIGVVEKSHLEVVLPLAGSQDDILKLQGEVKACLGEDWLSSTLTESHDAGFVRLFLLRQHNEAVARSSSRRSR